LSRRLFRSTLTIGSLTTFSRVLGYVRDTVIAVIAGAGAGSDAFFVAFRIPNFLRRLFAEGAFSQAFVPVIAEYRAQRGDEAVRDLVASAAGTLGGVVFLVTAVGVVAAPVLILIFAPGFLQSPEKYDLAARMLRITFPYLLFISLTALAGGVLNTYERFAGPAFTPVLLNLCMIGAALWLAPHMQTPVVALAWGVFLGGIAQLLLQFPFLLRIRMVVRPRFRPRDEGVRKILRLMLPAIFGVSVSQINLLVDTLLASFLQNGSVSWLYYSDRLVEFPLGVFGLALATVLLPALSREHARSSPEAFSSTLDWAIRWAILIGVPATIGLAMLGGPMLSTLFQHGAFQAGDVRMATLSLVAFSVGLTGFILVKVLAPAFYARQNTRTPVRIAVVAMVSNMAMNLMLIFTLAHAGLALATSLAAIINAGLLYRSLIREGIYRPGPGWGALGLRLLAANSGLALVLWYGPPELSQWLVWSATQRAVQLMVWVSVGAAVYFGLLLIGGVRLRGLVRAGGA